MLLQAQIFRPLPDKEDFNTVVDTLDHPAFIVYRTLRMLLGPLLLFAALAVIKESLFLSSPASLPQVKPSLAMANLLKDITLREPAISYNVLEKCWQATVHAVTHYNSSYKWETSPSLLDALCVMCSDYVRHHSIEYDVPFGMFLSGVSASQFVSQDVRVEMWIRCVLLEHQVTKCANYINYLTISTATVTR